MGLQLVAQGTDPGSFREALSRTPGEGLTVVEVDVPDRPVLRNLVRGSLAGMDAAIKAIPGVHLSGASTYSSAGGTGTVRVQLYTNPLPLVPIAVAAAIVAALAIVGVLSWRIYKVAGDVGVALFLLLLAGGFALGLYLLLRRGV